VVWVVQITADLTPLFTNREKRAKGEMVCFGWSGKTSTFYGNRKRKYR